MGLHDGHREKMKQRYRIGGLESFADHEVLELLLFHAIPRQDTNPIAHRLVDKFGSLSDVLKASPEELATVEGMGANAATFLSLIFDVDKRLRLTPPGKDWILNDLLVTGNYLMELYTGYHEEVAYQLCLDRKSRLIATRRLAVGNFATANISMRTLIANAINTGASSVILAHNHPSGIAMPSPSDVMATEQMQRALYTVGITLLDHLVIVDGDFVSMAESGLILEIEE